MNREEAILSIEYALKWVGTQPEQAGKTRVRLGLTRVLVYLNEQKNQVEWRDFSIPEKQSEVGERGKGE